MSKDISEQIGLTSGPFLFEIERNKIKEFAGAIGDSNPIYYSKEEAIKQGYRDIPVPPTFGTAIEMWAGLSFENLNNFLKLDLLKVLHGEQTYEYFEDICAGDVIEVKCKVIDAVTKRNMHAFTLETVYTNQEGRVAMKSYSTVLETF